MFQANLWEDWGFLLKELPSIETWCSGLTQYTWPCYKYENVYEKAFRQLLFISNRYKICLLGLTVYSFSSHSSYTRRTLCFTTLTVIVWFFDYLVCFDGKEVICFGRIWGVLFIQACIQRPLCQYKDGHIILLWKLIDLPWIQQFIVFIGL